MKDSNGSVVTATFVTFDAATLTFEVYSSDSTDIGEYSIDVIAELENNGQTVYTLTDTFGVKINEIQIEENPAPIVTSSL